MLLFNEIKPVLQLQYLFVAHLLCRFGCVHLLACLTLNIVTHRVCLFHIHNFWLWHLFTWCTLSAEATMQVKLACSVWFNYRQRYNSNLVLACLNTSTWYEMLWNPTHHHDENIHCASLVLVIQQIHIVYICGFFFVQIFFSTSPLSIVRICISEG